MDKLQGGDWNSFFHKFEAVASQSTASVSRPSIVGDNVPLPIIRGHHFDIAYQETMDELVKCQVCGMLLRRAMFAAHIQQRHAELCPPSMSTDDDSGRHSGLESPDISRNPNFPFSPKLMSPSVDKDPTELTLNVGIKVQRKSKRRRLKRDRRNENEPSSVKQDTLHSSLKSDFGYDDRSLSQSDNMPGTSAQLLAPNFLEIPASLSDCSKTSESCEDGHKMIVRLSPSVDNKSAGLTECEEDFSKKRKKKSRRKTKKREHVPLRSSSSRSHILPIVRPISLELSSNRNLVQETSMRAQYSLNDLYGTTKESLHSGKAQTERGSCSNVRKHSEINSSMDMTSTLSDTHSKKRLGPVHHLTQTCDTAGRLSVTVGQPAERAKSEADKVLPDIHDVATISSSPHLIYSQSQISSEHAFMSNYEMGYVPRLTANVGSLQLGTVPCEPMIKSSTVPELQPRKVIGTSVHDDYQITECKQTDRLVSQDKLKQFTKDSWKPLGLRCTTYDIVLPVVSRQDDADDATVAFLTSSPDQLSDDDSCVVKEEIEEHQDKVLSKVSLFSVPRHRLRQTQWISSESSDSDKKTVVEEDESDSVANVFDGDDDVQKLSLEFATVLQPSHQQCESNIHGDLQYGTEISSILLGNKCAQLSNVSSVSTSQFAAEDLRMCSHSREPIGRSVYNPFTCAPSAERSFNSVNRQAYDNKQAEEIGMIPHELAETPILAGSDGVASGGRTNDDFQDTVNRILPHTAKKVLSRVSSSTFDADANNLKDVHSDITGLLSREDGGFYDEDYSVEDEELVSLHENPMSSYPLFSQQSEHRQAGEIRPVPISHVMDYQAFGPQSVLLRGKLNSDSLEGKSMSQNNRTTSLWDNVVGRSELSIQTTFENNSCMPLQHSEPILQRPTTLKGSTLECSRRGPVEIGTCSQQQKFTPHSFPSQRSYEYSGVCKVPPIDDQIQLRKELTICKEYPTAFSRTQSNYEISCDRAIASQQRHIPYEHYTSTSQATELYSGIQRPQIDTNQTTIKCCDIPSRQASLISIIGKEPPVFPQISCRNISLQKSHGQGPLMQVETQNEQFPHELQIQQHERPAQLMEEEMRAMRYIYLMNEQKIAKKSLAELDRKSCNRRASPSNLMLLSELPSIRVEPTVVPEGVSKRRMQEQILPPFYHAQFAVRSGPSVSPIGHEAIDESSNETQILHEIMNLELLEPPTTRPVGCKSGNIVETIPGRSVPKMQMTSEPHQLVDLGIARSHYSGQHIRPHHLYSSDYLAPSVGYYSSAQDHDSLQGSISNSVSVTNSMPTFISPKNSGVKGPDEKDVHLLTIDTRSANESESDMSLDETFSLNNKKLYEECSDDSTDSETIRRRWDLSPSVTPLTLEALASGLSSPEGSDSSDCQSDVPVWSTMSRKHAKIAIAVCRTMPKRLQPLCRRFAWQQGITYLLENFCLQKWEIREEHDTESVWFFDKGVRRFKPFDKKPWDIPDISETSMSDVNVFYGFNICADIPMKRCRKTIRIEDRASVSLNCKEVKEQRIHVAAYTNFESSGGSTNSFDDDSDCSDVTTSDSMCCLDVAAHCPKQPAVIHVDSPRALSYEKQEFIAMNCCKQFLQQMVARKKGELFNTTGRSAVYVTSILAELFREHRSAYELMIADIVPIPTPEQREIPFSDDAEWVAARILAINRAQNRLLIPSFPPWTTMQRMWRVYGPVQQLGSVIGGEFEKFINECISVAYNHYYRLKNGIKVADRIPGDLLELCFAITSERMREHIESVEAKKSKVGAKMKPSRSRVPLKRRERLSSFVSQQTANHELLRCCRRIYDEKRQTKRRRWNTMRYLHNALPGSVIEGIDVFDMAQRTSLSVAGIFGPEHKLGLDDLPFASEMDNRPAYLDMDELLNLMDHTLAIQSDTTIDHEGNVQPYIDFLTVRGLQFKAIMGGGRCHIMVSPAPIPVPPVTVDRYGNMTSTQRALVPNSLYPELISRKMHGTDQEQFLRAIESPTCNDDNEIFDYSQCPNCLWTTEDRVDMDFAKTCLKGLPMELLEQITVAKVDTANTTYRSREGSQIMTDDDLINLLASESQG